MELVIEKQHLQDDEGCKYRVDIQKKNGKIQSKIDKHLKEIEKLQAEINDNLKIDKELADYGYCLIDKDKIIPNPITGKVMSRKKVHQNDCIFIKGSE